jgi:Uma2 family endonuclease
MGNTARRVASYQDVLEAPEGMIAQVVDGELHLEPRPGTPHAAAASALGEELGPPFKRGKGGPGGWILLDEPELHLGADILVPDLAGWRRERMGELEVSSFISIAPNWVCEVLSPSTARIDRIQKLRIYAREQVSHAWIVDPMARTLEVFRRETSGWLLVASYAEDERVRAEPFDAIELELSVLWMDVKRT